MPTTATSIWQNQIGHYGIKLLNVRKQDSWSLTHTDTHTDT